MASQKDLVSRAVAEQPNKPCNPIAREDEAARLSTDELDRVVGPFELCHCNRCKKVSGSAFMAAIGVRREDFRWISGRELIRAFEAPLLQSPPAYRVCFCTVCGSCVPDPEDSSELFEIAAGLLDDDPRLQPDKHIFVEMKAPWFEITDDLRQMDKNALLKHRQQVRQTEEDGT